ncbi:hypothetical protein [Stenotrophomonas maltophilia]|uniref:hypothetical protein n=1 Tax=Stenotrophomonas maltophilia TaxID=40324 RepID=UPI001FA7D1E2|nr:hypothetical protein [Stenotrophomonas maltophilia]
MHFKDLYEHRQGLGFQVDLTEIRRKLRELTTRGVMVVELSLRSELMLGFYISPRNEDTLYFNAPPGAAVVVISDQLNECWARFVQVKELLHLFDDPLRSTNNEAELEELLVGIHAEKISFNQQISSEFACMWMAVALMCREVDRVEFARQREAGSISDYDIALQLKMPEKFVPALFYPNYKELLAALTQK